MKPTPARSFSGAYSCSSASWRRSRWPSAAFWWFTRPRTGTQSTARFDDSGSTGDRTASTRALGRRDFAFPRDHGPHLDYQTEWWYYTGNLATADGRRVWLSAHLLPARPHARRPGARCPTFATNQIYFAHFAMTDVAAGDPHSARALQPRRGRPGRRHRRALRVWLDDWRVDALDADGAAVHLAARQGDLALDLNLRAAKPIVAHGDRGLSPKSDAPGNASYYLSYTRMATTGSSPVGDTQFSRHR